MYHWRDVTISRGLSPFSKKFALRCVATGSVGMSPDAVSASTIALRALKVVLPATSASKSSAPGPPASHCGTSRVMRPSRLMIERVGSCSSRHHCTSVRSPNVQHIAMPAPLSGSAR